MKALLMLLLAGAAAPALAQHSGHTAPTAPSSATQCTPEHAAMGHCTMPPPAKMSDPHGALGITDQQPQQSTCTPEHAAMGHCTLPALVQQPPQSNCTPEHAAMGHCTMPAQPQQQPTADPHAGHQMGTAPPPPKGPPPPEALTGPQHAADAVYDPARMAASREELRREHGDLPAYRFLIDLMETRVRDGSDAFLIEGEAWYGGDIDKLWFKTELEGEWGEGFEGAELQGLWSHAIDPWFDLQAGVRYDARKGSDRAHLVLGIQGLAPYWWEVDGAVFLSDKGEVTARGEAEYDLRITQKLILQPRAELDLSLQDIPELQVGAGLTSAALGARLRYHVTQLFAPYVGLEYERAFGDTRRFLREEGDDAGGLIVLAGVRMWF